MRLELCLSKKGLLRIVENYWRWFMAACKIYLSVETQGKWIGIYVAAPKSLQCRVFLWPMLIMVIPLLVKHGHPMATTVVYIMLNEQLWWHYAAKTCACRLMEWPSIHLCLFMQELVIYFKHDLFTLIISFKGKPVALIQIVNKEIKV